jgi:hypothetical protein
MPWERGPAPAARAPWYAAAEAEDDPPVDQPGATGADAGAPSWLLADPAPAPPAGRDDRSFDHGVLADDRFGPSGKAIPAPPDGRAADGGAASPAAAFLAADAELVDDPWAWSAEGGEQRAGQLMAPDLVAFLPPRRTPPAGALSEQDALSPASGMTSPDYIAWALEEVARRVRDGSLVVGEIEVGSGESAAVAAALAALLGVRR